MWLEVSPGETGKHLSCSNMHLTAGKKCQVRTGTSSGLRRFNQMKTACQGTKQVASVRPRTSVNSLQSSPEPKRRPEGLELLEMKVKNELLMKNHHHILRTLKKQLTNKEEAKNSAVEKTHAQFKRLSNIYFSKGLRAPCSNREELKCLENRTPGNGRPGALLDIARQGTQDSARGNTLRKPLSTQKKPSSKTDRWALLLRPDEQITGRPNELKHGTNGEGHNRLNRVKPLGTGKVKFEELQGLFEKSALRGTLCGRSKRVKGLLDGNSASSSRKAYKALFASELAVRDTINTLKLIEKHRTQHEKGPHQNLPVKHTDLH